MPCGMKNTPSTTCHDLSKVPSSSRSFVWLYHICTPKRSPIGASLEVIYLINCNNVKSFVSLDFFIGVNLLRSKVH